MNQCYNEYAKYTEIMCVDNKLMYILVTLCLN